MMLWTQVGIEAEVDYRQAGARRQAREHRIVKAAGKSGRDGKGSSGGRRAWQRRLVARWTGPHLTA